MIQRIPNEAWVKGYDAFVRNFNHGDPIEAPETMSSAEKEEFDNGVATARHLFLHTA